MAVTQRVLPAPRQTDPLQRLSSALGIAQTLFDIPKQFKNLEQLNNQMKRKPVVEGQQDADRLLKNQQQQAAEGRRVSAEARLTNRDKGILTAREALEIEKEFGGTFIPQGQERQGDRAGFTIGGEPAFFRKSVQGSKQKQLKVPGFERESQDVVLTPDDVKTLKNISARNKQVQKLGAKIIQRLVESGPTSGLNLTQNDKLLGADIAAMNLELKELFNLGVLNGGDLKIINETVGGITGVGSIALGKEAAIERLQNILNTSTDKVASKAEASGLKIVNDEVQIPSNRHRGKGLLDAKSGKKGQNLFPDLNKASDEDLDRELLQLLESRGQ